MSTPDDIKFKELVLKNKMATEEEIEECWLMLENYREVNIPKPLSSIMLDKGILSQKQANAIYQLLDKEDVHLVRGYTILSKLGQGGLGAVYKAMQDSVGREVALKIMFPQFTKNSEYIRRFMREAKISCELSHDHIVRGIDFGESNGLYYFAMEYISGLSLKQLVKKRGRLDEPEGIRVILAIADALKYAEEKSLIHRDIKPENIMLLNDTIPKLCDLGLAKNIEQDVMLTSQGIVVGTPHYMSPEQSAGDEIDIRADIYSLGITFYHILIGEVPYKGTTAINIINQHINSQIPAESMRQSGLQKDTCQVISTMMAKSREDRYQTTQELIVDLKRLLRGEAPLTISSGERTMSPNISSSKRKVHEQEDPQAISNAETIAISLEDSTPSVTQTSVPALPQTEPHNSSKMSSISSVSSAPIQDHVKNLEQKVQKKRPFRMLFKMVLFLIVLGAGSFYFQDSILNLVEKWKEKTPEPVVITPKPKKIPPPELARENYEKIKKELQVENPLPPSTDNMVFIEGNSEIKGFWIDKFEVSNQQYFAFCQETKSPAPQHWHGEAPKENTLDYPVVQVNWYDASLYALWAGKRLCTEEEWVYVVKEAPDSEFPWGKNYIKNKANINTTRYQPVDSYAKGKTASGVFNMAGNIWEWTQSIPENFPENYVVKGGSFSYPASYAEASYQDALFPHTKRYDLGFRCALSQEE